MSRLFPRERFLAILPFERVKVAQHEQRACSVTITGIGLNQVVVNGFISDPALQNKLLVRFVGKEAARTSGQYVTPGMLQQLSPLKMFMVPGEVVSMSFLALEDLVLDCGLVYWVSREIQ